MQVGIDLILEQLLFQSYSLPGDLDRLGDPPEHGEVLPRLFHAIYFLKVEKSFWQKKTWTYLFTPNFEPFAMFVSVGPGMTQLLRIPWKDFL